jgi:hypothetical protein
MADADPRRPAPLGPIDRALERLALVRFITFITSSTLFTSGILTMSRYIASGLSLLALVVTAACSTPPTDLDLALTHATDEKKFIVALQPPATPAAINQIHSWKIKLTSPTGQPVTDARIAVDGGMPQHGHGLPTRPQVSPELVDGMYLLEGMKFSMTGWWEIKLAIQSAEGNDKVTFNTVVATPSAAH